jgi:EmrB/QacA subfamily drug resistance transporter
VFLGALDQTVIVTVLPAVVTDLEIPFDHLDQAAWIVSGYLLGYTVALPLMGQFADVRGRRLALAIALGVFATGSAVCAIAASLGLLIAARIVQAAGGGSLLPVAVAVISGRFLPSRRVLLIGVVGATAEAGGVLGPLYGAAIVNALSWRWIFWLNLPLAALCLGAAWRGLPSSMPSTRRLDLPGAGLIGLAIGALILGLAHESVAIGGLDARPVLLVAALAGLIAFVAHERRAHPPLIELSLFRRRAFAAGIAGALLLGVGLIVAMVDVPLYAATVLNLAPGDGGLLLMRMTALIPIGALVGGAAGQRLGFGLPTIGGFVIAGCGLVVLSTWGIAPSAGAEWVALAIAGVGFGLLIAPLTTAVIEEAGPERAASAASTFTVARLGGMTVGLSALTAWGLRRFEDLTESLQLPLPVVGESAADAQNRLATFNQALIAAGAEVYREIFVAAAVACIAGVAVGIALWTTGRASPKASAPP